MISHNHSRRVDGRERERESKGERERRDSKQVADALVINFEIAKNVCGTWRGEAHTHTHRFTHTKIRRYTHRHIDRQTDCRAEYLLYSSGTSEF